jgi:MerR family transcriptional regulator, copper efflux regulator
VTAFTVGQAAARTGWSPRMLRYLEAAGLVVPVRTQSGYRVYGRRELTRLRSLRAVRQHFGLELTDVAFAARLHREPELRRALETWVAGVDSGEPRTATAWVDWEQRKQERLLAA